MFFNDLPDLTRGRESELAWRDVPALCCQHKMSLRLALYEELETPDSSVPVASEAPGAKANSDGCPAQKPTARDAAMESSAASGAEAATD